MRILQLIYESKDSPFGFGGAGVRAYEIYSRLANRHEITLLCMKYPKARNGMIGGVDHRFLGIECADLARSVLCYTAKTAEYVMKHGRDYDVIVENFLPATPFFTKYLTTTPVVLQLQGLWGRNHIQKFNAIFGIPLYIIEQFYPRLYDQFVFVTDVNMSSFIKRSGRYSVIPNGINQKLLDCHNSEQNYILFLSRIDIHQKGLDLLVDAYRKVSEKYDCQLVLAGHETNSMSRLLDRLPKNLKDRVRFAGFVSGDEKVRLLSAAKVFVMPSRYEAHPISVLEALACGKAVLVSDIPEFQYIARNGMGLTFSNGSAEDLTDKLTLLLEDRSMRETMGPKGREYVSRFLWDQIAEQFESFLAGVLDGPANRTRASRRGA